MGWSSLDLNPSEFKSNEPNFFRQILFVHLNNVKLIVSTITVPCRQLFPIEMEASSQDSLFKIERIGDITVYTCCPATHNCATRVQLGLVCISRVGLPFATTFPLLFGCYAM